jgi:murein L,D-transpeptidase YcbB/YkuD
VNIRSRAGKALILALFSIALANCGNKAGVQPNDVESGALQSNVTDAASRAFYKARQWQAAWHGDDEKALLAIIAGAPANALKPDLFLKQPLPRDANAREAALTKAALGYASALARGYTDPSRLVEIYTIPAPKTDVAAGLANALADGKLQDWFASLPPQTDEYRALSNAHLRYLRQAGQANAEPVPSGKPIKAGSRDPRLAAIAASLSATGYLPPPQDMTAPPRRYSREMVAAVKRLQADYGLKPDGVIGEDTLGAINAGPAGRARQLAIAMERLRWLERDPPATRIDVNTAAATLDFWRDGRHYDRRKVVVGEPDKPTPQIQAPIFRLVANPTWTVPTSIAEEEISKKGSGWLAANNFVMKDGRYVQQSGPKNSLGLAKFDMDDKYAIYLHDTPAKALFGLPDRHRSHGCVRVENALQLAGDIAARQGVLGQFQRGMASGDETFVKLKRSIPVRLLYRTAFWDGSRIEFRPDVYGRDEDVAAALGLVHGAPRKPYQPQGGDIGP